MRKRLFVFTGILLLAMSFFSSGCGALRSPEAPMTEPDESVVLIQDYKFQPNEITIKAGETVIWINKDSVMHNATDNKTFDTGLLNQEQSFSQTFKEAGVFDYHCTPHPYMLGKVIVK